MIAVKAVFDELAATASTLAKRSILEQHTDNADFKSTLNYLLNPFVITGISKKKMIKPVEKEPAVILGSFFEVMEYLLINNTGTDQDIANIQAFLNEQDDELRNFYEAIITKTARIGCDTKSVNKVFGKDFIPQWEVQQSYSLQNVPLKESEWFSLSQKLNGVRGTFYDGRIISRQGKEFSGLDHIVSDLSSLSLPFDTKNFVFDGELIRRNSENVSDNENFRIGTGILSQDDADKSEIMLVIFDMLPKEEYDAGESTLSYVERREQLELARTYIIENNLSSILVVDMLYSGYDQEMIEFYLDKMVEADKEGLMLNRDSKYYCKRHNGILKIKRFYTVDLEIVDCEEGTGRLSGKLGSFIVMYKDNRLNVGSGISDEMREEYWNYREALIGRVIEVKYKEESFDKKTGAKSLQFPIFVCLRELGKVVSYS